MTADTPQAAPRTARKELIDLLDEGGFLWEDVHDLLDRIVRAEAASLVPAPPDLDLAEARAMVSFTLSTVRYPNDHPIVKARRDLLDWFDARLALRAAASPATPDARPEHHWNDPDGDGHDCADCPTDSMWKCDAAAHIPGHARITDPACPACVKRRTDAIIAALPMHATPDARPVNQP